MIVKELGTFDQKNKIKLNVTQESILASQLATS